LEVPNNKIFASEFSVIRLSMQDAKTDSTMGDSSLKFFGCAISAATNKSVDIPWQVRNIANVLYGDVCKVTCTLFSAMHQRELPSVRESIVIVDSLGSSGAWIPFDM
jgi:hypothetical protein